MQQFIIFKNTPEKSERARIGEDRAETVA